MPIPKKIHYCWLSGDPLPEDLQKCLRTWQAKMPDYELVLWDKNKFAVDSVPYVAEACRVKKWAFAADYIRLHALHAEGGIYLDSDVVVCKSFDNFLNYGFFSALEYVPNVAEKRATRRLLNADGSLKKEGIYMVPGLGIQAAIMGAQKGHPYLRDCLSWYEKQHFILPDGSYNTKLIAPTIYAAMAIKYGFRFVRETQYLAENMVILAPNILASNSYKLLSQDTYAVHVCQGSWLTKNPLLSYLRRSNLLRKILGKMPLLSIDEIIQGDFRQGQQ
ncbi:mannosyltransferase OCH1 and related enzymes [Candidatus Termititenax persephonae]|uniref:Mannosyltransferase OCH1 and related enzymes n=1 Tax=Candidatus Termititenax persephonae TaxID=2218525 RepID=A0A388TG89_9BACT|nr:mannosyltransferase OCH1 and related enzymes [Candidatus Termititenax persephonae]